jgi:hypothetical protein
VVIQVDLRVSKNRHADNRTVSPLPFLKIERLFSMKPKEYFANMM